MARLLHVSNNPSMERWKKKYDKLLQTYDREKKSGNADTANEIAACLNVARKLRWKISKIVCTTSKFTNRDVANDLFRDRLHGYWDLDAEYERLAGRNYSDFSWLKRMIEEYSSEAKCAPLILIRAQSAINYAFRAAFDMARALRYPFNYAQFGQIAVHQFRVPGEEVTQNIDYLLKKSSVGRRLIGNNVEHRVTLCPGIERVLQEEEKEGILAAMAGVENGNAFAEMLASEICRRKNGAGYNRLFDHGIIYFRALEYFDEQCWLILDNHVRVSRGWGALGNDGIARSHIVALKW